MDHEEFAGVVRLAFERLGHDHPAAILADAALHYNSTAAHNARAIGEAIANLRSYGAFNEAPDSALALAARADEDGLAGVGPL